MGARISRRQALHHVGAGAALLAHPTWLSACAARVGEPPQASALSVDPDTPYWMQNNFAPVAEEREVLNLQVEGELPADLSGTFVRNGPNPKHGSRGHFLVGDGMLHGVRLRNGRAEWYRNRWVQTAILDRDRAEPVNAQLNPADTTANVSVVQHAGQLLALGEAGLPMAVSPELETQGVYDFGGRLMTWMTAHPKIDPISGELHMFGYSATVPHLTVHRVSATGELVRSVPITLPAASVIHDLQITQNWLVLLDLPLRIDLKRALAGDPLPARWQPEHGARIGLLPRDGADEDVVWFEIEPCYVFHAFNAYEDETGRVVLDVCRMQHAWKESPDIFDVPPQTHRYTLDPHSGQHTLQQVDDRPVDFPQIDPRRVGRQHRYGYGLVFAADAFDSELRLTAFGGHDLIKYDRVSDRASVLSLGAALDAGEPVFVPRSADAAEDDGYLMTFIYDRRTQTSSLGIFDAHELERGAVAKVQLPVRVPYGFHGYWVPA